MAHSHQFAVVSSANEEFFYVWNEEEELFGVNPFDEVDDPRYCDEFEYEDWAEFCKDSDVLQF